MANYRKSFNFRSGVQVDDDNFIVNSNGLVGIGTSIPTEFFDLRGNAKIVGLVTAKNLAVTGVSTFYSDVKVGSAITLEASTNSVYATTFYGSASGLTGIYALAVDGWYVDSGNSGIYTSFKVGIGTTSPQYSLQIGSDPFFDGEGISFASDTGNIVSSGEITASSFVGNLDSSYLTGTIDNARLPSSISVGGSITASSSFYGDLIGIAASASSINPSANITVNSINSGFSTSGISTVYTTLHVSGNIGVGTVSPNAQLHVRKSGISSIQLTSDGSNSSIITFGRSVTINSTSSNAQFRFGNTDGSYLESTEQSLDIINYDTGNLNFYLNPGGSGTGSYNWFKSGISKIMTLTSSGNLGINSSSPTSRLSVEGDCYLSGIVTVGSGLTVNGSSTVNALNASSVSVTNNLTTTIGKIGVKVNSPVYDLQVGEDPDLLGGVGITTSGNIICSGNIQCGIITASVLYGDASGLTNITSASVGYASTAGIATVSQGLTGTPNIVVGVATATTLNITGNTTIKDFTETRSTASIASNILSLNAANGTVFSHTTSANIGIVSFSSIPTTSANCKTFTVLVTQGAVGYNTTAATGIGTQLATIVTDTNVAISTHIKVGSGTTITLTNSAGALDLLTFIVSYNGVGIASTNFTIVGFAATNFRGVI